MSSKEIYVSTDVEADGPIPGPNSMLSFGSAAYTGRKELIGTFSANLETLPGATAHPKTAEWWARQPEAWAACRQELEMPEGLPWRDPHMPPPMDRCPWTAMDIDGHGQGISLTRFPAISCDFFIGVDVLGRP
jgi:hypothetical protein